MERNTSGISGTTGIFPTDVVKNAEVCAKTSGTNLAQTSGRAEGIGISGTNFGTKNSPGTTKNRENATNASCATEILRNARVSCFRNYSTPDNPVTIDLITWLSSAKYKAQVETIRAEPDKATRDKIKATLPAVTISGIFSYRRSDKLLQHSGLIALDIDYHGNEGIGNFSDLKGEICKIANVAYCGLSVSGQGYFAIIPIAYPDRHREQFDALQRAFRKLGIEIDPACKNVDRLRGYSFDDDPYFNPDPKVYHGTYSEPRPVRITYRPTSNNDAAKVESCLNQLSQDITGDYHTWFRIGAALANGFGEDGRQYFHQVSRFHPDYSGSETDKQFSRCLKACTKINLGTFFHYCDAVGIRPETANSHAAQVARPAPSGNYFETLRDGRVIEMCPAGYPADWNIPAPASDSNISNSSPLERLCTKYPRVGELVERLDCVESKTQNL